MFVLSRKEKKEKTNPDKPNRPAHKRIVVRIKCSGATARRKNKPGGYPTVKKSPVIKCVPKGPGGAGKLKPNGRRSGKQGLDSKPLRYQKDVCENL